MIPAYSPQARGRSERNFGTWQGRLPQELRLAGCTTLEAANRFLREHYVAEFNHRFQLKPEQAGSAFVPCRRADLDNIFSLWRKLRTTNVIERCFVEVRRRTRPMVCFVNVGSVDRIIYSIFQRFNLEWKTRTLNLFTQAA